MRHRRSTAALIIALAAVLAATATPSAQARTAESWRLAAATAEPGQVRDLTLRQGDGYATLAWTPVEGATDYQIERTPVDADGNPTADATVVGLWRPNRQLRPHEPTFADAGFVPGQRYGWRVRARIDGVAQPYSAPLVDTTRAQWGDPGVAGENLRTGWESSGGTRYTSDTEEYVYTADLDRLSDRMRVIEIGRTVLGRPINMFALGYPRPAASAEEIARSSPLLINCNVHGNEPGDREACLILARKLAFGTDARTLDLLGHTTVLIVPTINGDGRAANSRGNSTGQDLNRDYSLVRQPETLAFVRMLRDYRPVAGYDGHEYGNTTAGDLPMLPPRHLNVAQEIFDESLAMIEEHMYEQGARDGWWPCPYGCQGGSTVGMGEETILRNTLGLKNVVNSLLELRSSGGATRPDETNTANNRRRKAYSALWTFEQFLDYHRAALGDIRQARAAAIVFQAANDTPIVFRGSRTILAHPAPHPGESPPRADLPGAGQVLADPPCAYRLTEEQYHGARTDGPAGQRSTVAQRLAAHGWQVVRTADGYVVPLAQPERGLIPLLLDGAAAEGLVSGERVHPAGPARHSGPLTVTGVTCLDGATVNGPVTVRPGATLIVTGSTLNGPITAAGAAGVFLADSTVRGPVRITGATGAVTVIGTGISGPVEVSAGRTALAPLVAGNSVTGPLHCAGNAPAPTDLGVVNTVRGPASGQCAMG